MKEHSVLLYPLLTTAPTAPHHSSNPEWIICVYMTPTVGMGQ